MHHMPFVEVPACGDKLNKDVGCVGLVESFHFREHFKEFFPCAEFSHDVVVVVLFIDLIHFEDVGVVHLPQDIVFVQQ